MNIAIVDTETTGLEESARCIEAAVVLFSVEHACAIESCAVLIAENDNPAEAINAIPAASLQLGHEPAFAWETIARVAQKADIFLAHNADFDRRFVPAPVVAGRPWVCSKYDLEWPRQTSPGQSLVSLALAHGLGVSSAHRALTDCDILSRLLSRVAELGHSLDAMLARGMRPKATFQALVSFEDRDQAKRAGFMWEPATKRWLRKMAVEDAASLAFKTKAVPQ